MKEPKITITGRFTATGEEWTETANNQREFEFVLDKIYKNFENCGLPTHITIRGKTPKYVLNECDSLYIMNGITNI